MPSAIASHNSLCNNFGNDVVGLRGALYGLIATLRAGAINGEAVSDDTRRELVARGNQALLLGDVDLSLDLFDAILMLPGVDEDTRTRANWGRLRARRFVASNMRDLDTDLIDTAFVSGNDGLVAAELAYTLQLTQLLQHSYSSIEIPRGTMVAGNPADIASASQLLLAIGTSWDNCVYPAADMLAAIADDDLARRCLPSLMASGQALASSFILIGSVGGPDAVREHMTNAMSWLEEFDNPIFDGAALLCLALTQRAGVQKVLMGRLANLARAKLNKGVPPLCVHLYEIVIEINELSLGRTTHRHFIHTYCHFGRKPAFEDAGAWFKVTPTRYRSIVPSSEVTVAMYEYIATATASMGTGVRYVDQFSAAAGVISKHKSLDDAVLQLAGVCFVSDALYDEVTFDYLLLLRIKIWVTANHGTLAALAEIDSAIEARRANSGADEATVALALRLSEVVSSGSLDNAKALVALEQACTSIDTNSAIVQGLRLKVGLQPLGPQLANGTKRVRDWLQATGL